MINYLKILQAFLKMKLQRVETLIILSLRQIVIEDFSDRMHNYSKILLTILQDESEWIISNFKEIPLIFAKILRIFTFALSAEVQIYKTLALKLLYSIWQKRKTGK